jgi:hypothetical protein
MSKYQLMILLLELVLHLDSAGTGRTTTSWTEIVFCASISWGEDYSRLILAKRAKSCFLKIEY